MGFTNPNDGVKNPNDGVNNLKTSLNNPVVGVMQPQRRGYTTSKMGLYNPKMKPETTNPLKN